MCLQWLRTSCSRPHTVKLSVKALLLAMACLAAPTAWADYYIVVGRTNPVAELSQREVLHLYMGRARAFPDGSPAVAYDLGDGPQREGFYRALSGMTLPQVTSYWARLMFSGRNLPPQRVESEHAMVQKLQADPRAIGWLATPPRGSALRTVLVLKEAP